jgi:hypothetical protein
MGDAAYSLIGPLAFVGAVGGTLFATLIPWVLPRFKRPFVTAWVVSSLGLGGAIFIDEIVVQQSSLAGAVAWAIGVSMGLAIIVPLMWFRIHMWDVFFAVEERREADECNARYRPKDFAE